MCMLSKIVYVLPPINTDIRSLKNELTQMKLIVLAYLMHK